MTKEHTLSTSPVQGPYSSSACLSDEIRPVSFLLLKLSPEEAQIAPPPGCSRSHWVSASSSTSWGSPFT